MFESFDMPDSHETCPRRSVTTSPAQALTMLNSDLTLKWARYFASRVIAAAGNDLAKQIDAAFRFAFARSPDAEERSMIATFFDDHARILREQNESNVQNATLVDFCHMLINANEFVYQN
jgi:hypothetical protein